MAREAGMSQASVQRPWAASAIKLHRSTDRDTKSPLEGLRIAQAAPDAQLKPPAPWCRCPAAGGSGMSPLAVSTSGLHL